MDAKQKKEGVREAWKRCFGDTEEFINFYFARKYRDEDALAYEEGGKVLSAFLMLPYPLWWQGKQFAGSYISGACTLEEARQRGLMTRLLKEGFPKMYTRGVAVSTLIPAEEWLYGYYAKFGYATVFHRAIRPWHPSVASQEVAGVEIIEKAGETVKREAYLYAAGHWQTQACYIVHTPEDYDAVIEELYMSGGKIALLRKGNAIAGMALALPEQDSVSVKEILYDSETIREKLLQGIARHWQTERVVYRTANPGGIPMRPYGMARIIHVEMLLQHLATEHPQLEKSFCVQDPILPENNGLYLLSHGECRKASCPATLPAMDIVGLSKALLEWDDAHPYMNQMLD